MSEIDTCFQTLCFVGRERNIRTPHLFVHSVWEMQRKEMDYGCHATRNLGLRKVDGGVLTSQVNEAIEAHRVWRL